MMNAVHMDAQARRDKHRSELREEILAAAREIFVREGYESFSMRKLAARVACSPGSIYLHFKNKAELFGCLVEESFARLLKALEVLRDRREKDSPVPLLKEGLRNYVDFGLRHPNDYRLAFLLSPPLGKRRYRTHAAFEVLRQMVGLCVEEKRLTEADREVASQALWAAVHGVTSLLIQRPTFPWVAKEQLIEQVINSAVDGLLVTSNAVARRRGSHGERDRRQSR